ncbi:hypothetical protein [uncultured Paenibacillus sp.]|uniref:hypothetical protein n=1 Tax=uncultured Paenibacillus sp. TaxID=227322 RepID=UPI0028D626BB|nr:hypothetical protein [uncultured Paenibacillus sp.]
MVPGTEFRGFLEAVNDSFKLDDIDFAALSDFRNLLVIRSGSLRIFTKFIRSVQAVNPYIYFTVISHARDRVEIEEICGRTNCKVMEYAEPGNYDIKFMLDIVSELKNQIFDSYILLFNNRSGIDYANTIEIMIELTDGPLLAFNGYHELLLMNKPRFYLKSLALIRAVAEWNWEQTTPFDESITHMSRGL